MIITDKAGNEIQFTDTATTTKEPEIGDYVDYKPDNGTFTVESKYSGDSMDQTLATVNSFWRVWNIDKVNNKLLLTVSRLPRGNLYLQGAQGYNNGVKILNDLCEELYSCGDWAKARSLNAEDIYETVISKPSFSSKLVTKRINYTLRYPIIHMYEEGSEIDGDSTSAYQDPILNYQPLKRNQQYRYYLSDESGATNGYLIANETLNPLNNYNTGALYVLGFDHKKRQELLQFGDIRYDGLLATRASFSRDQVEVYYGINYIDTQTTCIYGMKFLDSTYDNKGNSSYESYVPIVEIELDSVVLGESGEGTSDNPLSIYYNK